MCKTIWKMIFEITEWMAALLALIGIIGLLLPRLFCISPYIVLSGSMEPEIHAGSIVYMDESITPEQTRENDIIGYRMNDEIKVVHRVMELDKNNHSVVTKGDANEVEDINPVMFEQIEGRAIISIPYMGYIVTWIRSKLGIIAITALVGIFFITMTGKNNNQQEVEGN